MKKKTKFKLKNDLAVPFWISVSVCLLCAFVNAELFYKSFFRALSKMNEEPIATITFKYKTAQRKFLERVVWDRLRQNSPVYNGDTIHTADLSEATIWFDDGTVLDLSENTMAQVFRHTDGSLAADLESGTATVDSSESTGLTLTAANVSVNVEAGTKISASKEEKASDVNLTVQKGSAQLSDGKELQAGSSLAVSESGETKAKLSVTSPVPNQKILYHTEEECPVDFEWNFGDQENEEKLELVISTDKDFRNKVQTLTLENLKSATVNLPKGNFYWKLASADNPPAASAESSSGKIQIIQALKPQLLTPAAEYSYQYRTKTPSIRFIWTESDTATAYNFAIANNPQMENPLIEQRSSSSSIIISTLPEGHYYWQVTPYYVVNRTGLANPSAVSRFHINQQGQLTAPELLAPADRDYINKKRSKISLSWQMEAEASSYKIIVSASEDLRSPLIERQTSENYITLNRGEVGKLKDGYYYWAVSQIDSEGNESARSEPRSFYAVNGDIEQRTLFPPEGYKIWAPLLTDTRFTWKTNIDFSQSIQIADDQNFNSIVYEATTPNTTFNGVKLEEGTYWWRIKADNGTFTHTSSAKKLEVVGEIEAPLPLEPTVQKRAIVRPSEAYTFKWEEVEGADYYRMRLFKAGSDEALADENFISEPEFSMSMENLEEGYYRWEVRAYTNETELASRRSGKLADAEFRLRKIRPVTLLYPKNGAEIDGWDAIEKPPVLRWASSEAFKSAELTLKKVSGIEAGEKLYIQKSTSQKMQPLSSGTYEWTVNATTEDELDISATSPSYFTVKEIPPYDAPVSAHTVDGAYFDAKYLREKPYIDFEWSKVKRAQAYIIEVFDHKGKRLHRGIVPDGESQSYHFDRLADLSKGKFKWTVKAVSLNKDTSEILHDGYTAGGEFEIDFTLNTSGGKRRKTGEYYGQ